MKKNISLLLILCLICIFVTNCSNKATSQPDNTSTKTQENSTAATKATKGVDVDLTALSSTMIYAEVYNMMSSPNDYLGKTIKINGPYYTYYYDETKLYYHYVIIQDATACCQQGLEFKWKGKHTYPDDYPEDKTEIELTGVFESYEELGSTFYYLAVNDISILNN